MRSLTLPQNRHLRETRVQVILGVVIPGIVGIGFGLTADPAAYLPAVAFMAVVVILAILSGRRAALVAAISSTVALDYVLRTPADGIFPAHAPADVGLLVFLGASLLVVVLVAQLDDARALAVRSERRSTDTARLLDTLVRNSPVGFAFLDHDLRYVLVNEALGVANGRSVADHIGRTIEEVVPNYPQLRALLTEQVLDQGHSITNVEVEGDVASQPGRPALWSVSYYPVPDATGAVVGVGVTLVDVTERNQLQALLLDAQARMANERLGTALEAMLDLVAVQRAIRDGDGKVVDFRTEFVNHPDLVAGGVRRGDLVGRNQLELYPTLAGSDYLARCVEAATTGVAQIIDDVSTNELFGPDATPGWFSAQIAPFDQGIIVVASDVSERHANLERLERAYEQLAAAQELAQVGIWAFDAGTRVIALSAELSRILGRADGEALTWSAIEVGERIHPDDRSRFGELIEGAVERGESFTADLRLLRPGGAITELSVFGTVGFDEAGEAERVWGTAQDVTERRRVERALRDAAVRLEREHTIVTRLQEAILPELPLLQGVEIGASYLPAGGESLVGGDWYDAFLLGKDRLVISIGDVAGHGLAAASLMSQLRNALRGAAYARTGPSGALRALSDLAEGQAETGFASCIYGELDLRSRTFTWANAGHPPLVLVDPLRGPSFMPEATGPPVGVDRSARYPIEELVLPENGTLISFTDGLVERRGEMLDIGLERLLGHVRQLDGLSPQELCVELGRRMFAASTPADDVCILAVRATSRRNP